MFFSLNGCPSEFTTSLCLQGEKRNPWNRYWWSKGSRGFFPDWKASWANTRHLHGRSVSEPSRQTQSSVSSLSFPVKRQVHEVIIDHRADTIVAHDHDHPVSFISVASSLERRESLFRSSIKILGIQKKNFAWSRCSSCSHRVEIWFLFCELIADLECISSTDDRSWARLEPIERSLFLISVPYLLLYIGDVRRLLFLNLLYRSSKNEHLSLNQRGKAWMTTLSECLARRLKLKFAI